MSKEHWKIKIYVSVLFLRTWRSGILFQTNITIFDIYMKGKTCIHIHLKLSHFESIFASQGLRFGSPFSPHLADLEYILKFARNATEYGTALTTILPILFLYLNTVTVTAGTFEP